jgi:hypothetical protein
LAGLFSKVRVAFHLVYYHCLRMYMGRYTCRVCKPCRKFTRKLKLGQFIHIYWLDLCMHARKIQRAHSADSFVYAQPIFTTNSCAATLSRVVWLVHPRGQGCQMVCFRTKPPNFGRSRNGNFLYLL